MAYNDVVQIAQDEAIYERIVAASAAERVTNPVQWARENVWHLAASPGWADAWAYAKDTATVNVNPNTGERDDVITDQMILSAVQQRITELNATTP